jgi:hypothetical protein
LLIPHVSLGGKGKGSKASSNESTTTTSEEKKDESTTSTSEEKKDESKTEEEPESKRKKHDQTSSILESGHIYFFYRPKIDVEKV